MKRLRKNAKKSTRRRKTSRSSKKSTVSAKLRTKKFNKLRKTSLKVKVSVPPETVKETYFYTKGKASRKIPGATNVFTRSPTGVQVVCDSGQQQYTNISMCTRSQLTDALAPLGNEPDNIAGSIADTINIYWRSARTTMYITNSTNTITNVTIYHYVYKRDTSIDASQLWLRGLRDAESSALADDTLIHGVRPQLSPMLNRYLKLKKTFDFTMAAGTTIKHNWFESMNRVINNEELSTDASPNNYYAGLTQCILIVAKGYPGTVQVPTTNVNTTPVKLDIAYVQEYRYTTLNDNTSNVTIQAGSGMGAVNGPVLIYDQNGSAGGGVDSELATRI